MAKFIGSKDQGKTQMHVNLTALAYLLKAQNPHIKFLKKMNERSFKNSGGVRWSSNTEKLPILITWENLRIIQNQRNIFTLPWAWQSTQAIRMRWIGCSSRLTLKIHKFKTIQEMTEEDPSPSWINKTKRIRLLFQHTHCLMITNLEESDSYMYRLWEEV